MFSNRASLPPKGSVPIRAFCVIRFFMLLMIKVLWAVMCISTHLPSRLECQQRGLNWNAPFILDNLIAYHCPGGILIKVLSWFCLEIGEGLLPVSRKLGSSLIQQASERQRSSLRWAPGQLFEIPEVLICLACQIFSSWPCHGWNPVCWLLADTERWTLLVGRCPICYWRSVEK